MTPAGAAQLALLLEVGSDPKPGNVDRGHDHGDTGFHHFLASAVNAYPALEGASEPVGEAFLEAVGAAHRHGGGNTHFGALLLLVPLVVASKRGGVSEVEDVVRGTGVEDAVCFYRAFDLVDVYVEPRERFDVRDRDAVEEVRREGLSLFDVMELSVDVDGVAGEWVNGFERCFRAADMLEDYYDGDSNEAIVRMYAGLLAGEPDSFVAKKHGEEVARDVRRRAERALERGSLAEFDRELIEEGINPGTTADICCAGIYVSLRRNGGFGV